MWVFFRRKKLNDQEERAYTSWALVQNLVGEGLKWWCKFKFRVLLSIVLSFKVMDNKKNQFNQFFLIYLNLSAAFCTVQMTIALLFYAAYSRGALTSHPLHTHTHLPQSFQSRKDCPVCRPRLVVLLKTAGIPYATKDPRSTSISWALLQGNKS